MSEVAATGALNELRLQLHAALDRCVNLAARIAELEAAAAAAATAADEDDDA